MHAWLYGDAESKRRRDAESRHGCDESAGSKSNRAGFKGYYHSADIGKEGDFYTAVSVSRFFGASIARYVLDMLERDELTLPLYVVEIGAHEGRLISDIYEFLGALSEGVVEHCEFVIIEPLASMRARQLANISAKGHKIRVAERLKDVVSGGKIASANDVCACGAGGAANASIFFVSNELFDAFACELVRGDKVAFVRRESVGESIGVRESKSTPESSAESKNVFQAKSSAESARDTIIWRTIDEIEKIEALNKVDSALATKKAESKVLDSGILGYSTLASSISDPSALDSIISDSVTTRAQTASQKAREILDFARAHSIDEGEIPLGWRDFVDEICAFASQFLAWRFLSFDYGDFGARGRLTLRGYSRHQALDFGDISENLGALFGKVDLTYDVDFRLLCALFEARGAKAILQGRLDALLIDFGITELLESYRQYADSRSYAYEARRALSLIGGSLGERFVGICFGSK